MSWLRRHYGAGPLHLLGMLTCFAVVAYAVTRVLGESGWVSVFQVFIISLVLHDFIGWPIYTAADRLLVRAQGRSGKQGEGPTVPGTGPATKKQARVPWANHVRFPTVISAVLLVMFFPLIFRLSNNAYEGYTGFNESAYFTNWLVVSGTLFALSALVYLCRCAWSGHRRRA